VVPLGLDPAFGNLLDTARREREAGAALVLALAEDRGGDRELGRHVEVEPAVPVDALPVARAPGLVARAVAREREALFADLEPARALHELIEVGFAEAALRVDRQGRTVLAHDLAADARRGGAQVHLEAAVDDRVLAERPARFRHLVRPLEQADLALVGDAVALERRDDL